MFLLRSRQRRVMQPAAFVLDIKCTIHVFFSWKQRCSHEKET